MIDMIALRIDVACLKSGASCSTLLATERSWPRVSASALTHWFIAIGSLWPVASSGRWGTLSYATSQVHADACSSGLVGAGLHTTNTCCEDFLPTWHVELWHGVVCCYDWSNHMNLMFSEMWTIYNIWFTVQLWCPENSAFFTLLSVS